MLDVRTPIGIMFGAIGLLLIAYGLIEPPKSNTPTVSYNLNVLWGSVMLAFAAGMLLWQRLAPEVEAPAPTEAEPAIEPPLAS